MNSTTVPTSALMLLGVMESVLGDPTRTVWIPCLAEAVDEGVEPEDEELPLDESPYCAKTTGRAARRKVE